MSFSPGSATRLPGLGPNSVARPQSFRDPLYKFVWGKAHRDDVEYLRVTVRAIRLKIEDEPSQPVLIRNEPGIGYRLA